MQSILSVTVLVTALTNIGRRVIPTADFVFSERFSEGAPIHARVGVF